MDNEDPGTDSPTEAARATSRLQEKWGPLLKGIEESHVSGIAASLLANQAQQLSRSTTIGSFNRFAFPLIRKAAPQLISNNIVSVQPMTGPVGSWPVPKKTPLQELTERVWEKEREGSDESDG